MQVLLLRPDKAGDAIKTLPAIRALVAQATDFEIAVLCSTHNASLFASEPNVSSFVLPKDWEQLPINALSAQIEKLNFTKQFDLVVNLLCDEFPHMEKLIQVLKSPTAERMPLSNGPQGREETLNIAEILSRALHIDLMTLVLRAPRSPRLLPEDETEAENTLGVKQGQRLGFCPFAGTENRTHPIEKWKHFIREITKREGPIQYFLFGGPSDLPALNALRSVSKHSEKIRVISPPNFRALGAYLKRMDGVIAVDSGPLHYTLAMDIPALGFLSGGDQKRWFARVGSRDKLLPRGLFSRYPSHFEMLWAYKGWTKQLFS